MKTDLSIFKVFQHSDEYFEMLSDPEYSRRLVMKQVLVIFVFAVIYGIVMGSYNGFQQSMATGLKVPCLIFLSLLICFPALFVIQYMIGSTMAFWQMANTILSGFVVFTTINISFAPIVIFFMITSDNYAFLKLLHVAIFIFAGIFAVNTIIKGLTYSCEKKNVYPKLGMNIFKLWVIIIAFVSSQLAWNLRPFVGSRNLPFEMFRERQGNFYIAVIQSVGDLVDPDHETNQKKQGESPESKRDDISVKSNGQ